MVYMVYIMYTIYIVYTMHLVYMMYTVHLVYIVCMAYTLCVLYMCTCCTCCAWCVHSVHGGDTYNLSRSDRATTEVDDMAIAAEAIHGANSIPSGQRTPEHTRIHMEAHVYT